MTKEPRLEDYICPVMYSDAINEFCKYNQPMTDQLKEKAMKKLTAEDLKKLTYGERVHRWQNHSLRGFRFVGFMPSSKSYLIFSDGEHLTHLYINEKDNSFSYEWYSGEYSPEFECALEIKYHEEKLAYLKEEMKTYTNQP